jgi:hypothetical protein
MTRVISLLLFVSGTLSSQLSAETFADSDTFSEFPALPDFPGLPDRVQNALKQAQQALDTYGQIATPANQQAMLAYLLLYRSWPEYQEGAATPTLINDINASAPSIAYSDALKDIAKQFILPPEERINGNKLSDDGATFYNYVISMTEKMIQNQPNH